MWQVAMGSVILSSLKWTVLQTRTYVYPDGTKETFTGVQQLTVMRTGCHVLETCKADTFVVAPGWRYIAQRDEA